MDQANIARMLLIELKLVLIKWHIWVNCTAWAQLLHSACVCVLLYPSHHESCKSQWHGVALYSALQTWLHFSSLGMGTEVQMRFGGTCFKHNNVAALCVESPCPYVVREVGCGLMQALWQAQYMICPGRQLIMLQGMTLNAGTAGELIHASKALDWSRLCPFLIRLADATYAWACTDSARVLELSLQAFHGLKSLLGKLVSILQQSHLP